MLWNFNEEDLTTKVNTGNWIKKSGVYIGTIIEADLINSTASKSRAIGLTIQAEEGKFKSLFWINKKDGSQNEFSTKILNRMLFLTKTKVEDLKPKVSGEKTTIPVLAEKSIGVFLEVKSREYNGEQQRDYHIVDFFEPKLKKTADEIKNKDEALNYSFFIEKFKNAVEIEIEKKEKQEAPTEKEEKDDDEFPF